MELTECLPLLKINYLKEMSFTEFKKYCSANAKSEEERKKQHNMLQGFCKANIKARGEMTRIYSFTQKTPLEVGGRLYCGNSLQGVSKQIRGFLCKDITTDIDMRNAHPTIARYLCKLHGIPCPNLSYYIENRDEVLDQFGSDGKELFLKALNNDKLNRKEKSKVFKDFDKECKDIQTKINKIPEYQHIVASVPESKLYNWLGSAFNRIMCVFENKILHTLISVINKNHIKICSLAFDGLMVYDNHYSNSELLEEITQFVNTEWVGLNMKWAYKQHSSDIEMPDEWEVKGIAEEIKGNDFKSVADKFEETHCKILNKSCFVRETPEDIIIMSKPQIITTYENIIYQKPTDTKDGLKVVDTNFIADWLRNNPEQKCYEDIGCFPDKSKCPSNYFNTWKPFVMETVTEYIEKPEALLKIQKHIAILCGNDALVATFLEAWIAQMIQYPAVKTICPTLISKEGAGKGTLIRLMEKMLGHSKVFETATPSRDIWGDFNGRMASTFLVNLNELSKRETMESEGRIKALITDPKLTINNKGVNQYDINSYHRFIISTNKEEPINSSHDDRRNLIIRSSDERCGDSKYFTELYDLLEDVNVIKTCYEYFKGIKGMDEFNKIALPVTDYHRELQSLSVSPLENWIKSLVLDKYYEETVEIMDKEQFNLFKLWCKGCGLDYNITSMQFAVRMKRLNIDGIQFGKHTNKGNTKIFDIGVLKKYFKMETVDMIVADEEIEEIEY